MDISILQMLEDDEFAERILGCISVEEVQSCFEDEGIDILEGDARKILSSVYGVNDELEEIDDSTLAYCVGGIASGATKDKLLDGTDKKNKLIAYINSTSE